MFKSLRLRSEESALCGYLHDGKGITSSLTFRGLPWLDMHFVELLKEQRKADGRLWFPFSNFGLFFITFPSLDRVKAAARLNLGQLSMIYFHFIRQRKKLTFTENLMFARYMSSL